MIRAQFPDTSRDGSESLSEAGMVDARALTAGGNTAQITLDGKVYTLRITRAGKLILTK